MPLPVGPVLARSLYLYENAGVQAIAPLKRDLYLYENKGVQALAIAHRSLYLYENRGIEALAPRARDLYVYEATRDGEVFPWLMKIDPTEQYRGGQVALFGDGFGELLEVAAGSTITTSSVNGGNVGGNAVDRTGAEWVSNDGAAAWIRFTFAGPQTIVAIALEDRLAGGNSWGVPLFRFSDAGADLVGATAVPIPAAVDRSSEYLVGTKRTLYTLPAPRSVTWVEVRVSSGGGGANRGLSEVWAYADSDQAAEGSRSLLAGELMGIVAWANRSPGLWPANSGIPILSAATVTVPVDGVSGLVVVEETI
jgi:hypothetical protein